MTRILQIGRMKGGGALYLTVEIRDTPKGPELSITGQYPRGGGQCRDALAEVETFAPGWNAELAAEVGRIWERYHLNGTQAGCEHQRAGWDLDKAITFRTYSVDWDVRRAIERNAAAGNGQAKAQLYDLNKAGIKPFTFAPVLALPPGFTPVAEQAHGAYLTGWRVRETDSAMNRQKHRYPPILLRTETKAASWVRPTEHPDGLLGKPCEVCGYAYGTRWLYEPLPQEVIDRLASLPDGGAVAGLSPYEAQAQEWLQTYGVTFKAEHAQQKAGVGERAQHWRVTLWHEASRHGLSFDFWNSIHATQQGKALTAYDVLACLSSDKGYTDVDEIARELELPPSQARKAAAFARRIQRWLAYVGPGADEALGEIG